MNYKFINRKIIYIGIVLIFFSFSFVSAQNQVIYYSAVIKIEGSETRIINSSVSPNRANLPVDNEESAYSASLLDIKGNTINKLALLRLKESPVSSGEENIYLLEFLLTPLTGKIVITDREEKEIYNIDLSVYNSCGDGSCSQGENSSICPPDCLSGGSDGYCDQIRDGICDPDCSDVSGSRDNDCLDKTSQKEKVKAADNNFPGNENIGIQENGLENAVSGSIILVMAVIIISLGLILVGVIKFLKKKNEETGPEST